MCRLAARFGAPVSPADLLFGGSHPLAEQAWAPRELLSGSVNADGWGVAWATEDGRMLRVAKAEPVWYDPDIPTLLSAQTAGAALAVLRNATPGLPVGPAGNLPMVRERWAFALNGFIPSFRDRHMRELRTELTDAGYARLEGVSDAETLFLLALDRVLAGGDPGDALLQLRKRVAARLGPDEKAPLTMVMAHSTGVWILHSSAGGPVNSLWTHPDGGPVPGGPIASSEALTEEGWSRVPDHTLVELSGAGVIQRQVGPVRR